MAPGVNHTKAFDGPKNKAVASDFVASTPVSSNTASRPQGALFFSRHRSVNSAPVRPLAVMMVSDSQKCQT